MATSSSPAFVKTPDTDASAKSAAGSPDAREQNRRRFPRWLLFALIAALVAAAAVAFLLFLRHRDMARNRKGVPAGSSSAKVSGAQAASSAPAMELPLDPFVVNLADAGGHSYARIGLTLLIVTPSAKGEKDGKQDGAAADISGPRAMVRDTIIETLNQERSEDLLATGGKEHLKQAIRTAVTARDPQIKIADIYFTEFLIQQ